ncbi:MAG TPA: helix-turn-helix domain-containing protein [Phototrophicaceae bacterium]|nr:helix-turn-helix domain-containing protein [Phototrophicaceae bacterium]
MMPKRVKLDLTAAQVAELQAVRNHHAKPYLRERAAALLKVNEGQLLSQVAATGLLKRHEPETVHGWIKAYHQDGLEGLMIRPGRGRKARFSPSHGDGSHPSSRSHRSSRA